MSDYFEVGQEFLEHYGKKGMKWGKTGGTASIKGPSTAKLKKESGGTVKLKTKGTVTFKPTAKGDLARASLGGVVFAPKSSARTAKRAVDSAKGTKGSLSKAAETRKAKVAASNATREAAKNAPKDVTVNSQLKRNKYKTKAKGGQKQPVADDAVTAIVSRQKLKKSGVDALSNKELQELSTRMNLEQQIRSLDSKRPKSQKDKFVEEALKDPQKTYEKASKGAEALQKLRK